jgi:hypothetical protein
MTAQEIANKYNCDLKPIRLALTKAGYDTKKNANDRNIHISVIQLDKNTEKPIQEFISTRAAALYM